MIPQVNLPAGQSGNWRVEHFTVTPDEASMDRMLAAVKGRRRHIKPGRYTRLMRHGTVVMSDTPDEMSDHRMAVFKAAGHCLVLGLGLGMVVAAMLEMPQVTRVTVVELSEDVIALTGPTLKARYGDRLEIIQGDALAWMPPKDVRYGVVWADIWDDITSENLPEMQLFNRRYAKRADWKGNWCEDECKAHREKSKKHVAWYSLA